MNAKVRKLAMRLRDIGLAQKLVEAGFDNPAKIRAASDGQLKKVPGVGQAMVAKIRKVI